MATDKQPIMIGLAHPEYPQETRVTDVEEVVRDSDGDWTARTFGCDCCSTWLSDYQLSDDDVRAAIETIMNRHARLADEYGTMLAKFNEEGR